jgi:transglutaminase-like putative cysteine protease
MRIRVGYELNYELPQSTPMILALNIHHSRVSDLAQPDHMKTTPAVPTVAYRDGFGNWCTRLVAPAGHFRLTSDATVNDTGAPDPVDPSPMDFAGWFEAYLGGAWHTFDPRNNVPRIGRVLIARGRDAADVAITTTFGPNTLQSFRVWTDEVTA